MRAPIIALRSTARRLRFAAALISTAALVACESASPTGNDDPGKGEGQPAPVTVARVDISGSSWLLAQGWGAYTATVVSSRGTVLTDRVPTWTVSDTAVAHVVNGSVYAKQAGEVLLVAAVDGRADTLRIVVRPLTVDSIVISQSGSPVYVGETGWMGAQLLAADGRTLYDRVVTWTSSDPSVATVDGGRVRGVRQGTVDIVATSEGRSSTRRIAVYPSRAAGSWTVRITELRNANTVCTVTGMRIMLTQVGDSLAGEIATGSPSVICTAIVGTQGPYTTPSAPAGAMHGTIADNGYVMLSDGDRWSIAGVLDRNAQTLKGSADYLDGDPEDMLRLMRHGSAAFARP